MTHYICKTCGTQFGETWWGRVVQKDAKMAVSRSTARYIQALQSQPESGSLINWNEK